MKGSKRFLRSSLWRLPSSLFGSVVNWRNYLYDVGYLRSRTYHPVPVIGVGNLSFGGTGKSEIVMALANYLKSIGQEPIIVSKGYKGRVIGPVEVEDQEARVVGDEPRMYKCLGHRVIVSRDKTRGVDFAVASGQNERLVVIVDDHLQHRRLRPSRSLVAVDFHRLEEFSSRAFLPYFREPWERLVSRIAKKARVFERLIDKVILVNRSGERIPDFTKQNFFACETLHFSYHLDKLEHYHSDGSTFPQEIPDEICAVSGIASANSFFLMLSQHLKEANIRKIQFSDHHPFTRNDICLSTPTITTLKDAVKIRALFSDQELRDSQLYYASIRGKFHEEMKDVLDWEVLLGR